MLCENSQAAYFLSK